ncbi:MAG TPA: hypothetical protein VIK92_02105 [Thermaerobacter sp.]
MSPRLVITGLAVLVYIELWRLARLLLSATWDALALPVSATAQVLALVLFLFVSVMLIPVAALVARWAAASIRRGA